jgi:hypothetical protein
MIDTGNFTMATAKQCVAETKLSYLLPICLVATLGGLLFGYDTGVISGRSSRSRSVSSSIPL